VERSRAAGPRELREQLAELQRAISELATGDDPRVILQRISTRARSAVRAQRCLLVVDLSGEGDLTIVADGLDEQSADSVVADLAEGRSPGEGAWVVVEVRSARRTWGHLAAVARRGAGFRATDRDLLRAYADLAAAALEGATARRAARERRRTSEVLLELSRTLARTTTPAEVFDALAAAVPSVMGAGRSSVLTYDAHGRLVVAAHRGWPPELHEPLRELVVTDEDTPELARTFASREPVLFVRATDDPSIHAVLAAFDAEGMAVAPIEIGERSVGVVIASWAAGGPVPVLDGHLTARLGGLADHAATTIANAELVAQVRHQATHDPITGLPNRLLLGDRLEAALAALRRDGAPFAVAYLDLDGFKEVNDTLGHASGDELLRRLGDDLVGTVREVDTVARAGGDEFVVVLLDIGDAEEVGTVARKLAETVAWERSVEGQRVSVEASIGVVLVDDPTASPTDLLRAADRAMYAAKAAGGATWRTMETLRSADVEAYGGV
jgi:diguanylate cyclase (GGDEF)-like protein